MHVSLTRLATTSITAGLVFILVGFPLVMLIGGSFAPPKGEAAISLRAYLVLFNDIDLLWNSIKVAIGSTILALALRCEPRLDRGAHQCAVRPHGRASSPSSRFI
jgi:ABC-type spermidine/putrescine transport system permease subunit II